MKKTLVAVALLGLAVLAPLARAQREYNPSLHFTVFGAEGHTYPTSTAVATDANGVLYTGELWKGVLRKLRPDGTADTLNLFFPAPGGERVPAKFESPTSFAVDALGNVYVAAYRSVCKIAPDGAATILTDGIVSPRGIAVDTAGYLYVADDQNHTIRKISPGGIVTTLAGKPGERGSADGTESARFSQPMGVAVDSRGNVFVADHGNDAIRQITPQGVVTTVAGRPGGGGPTPTGGFRSLGGIALDLFGTIYATGGEGYSYAGYEIYRIPVGGVATTLRISGGFGDVVEAGFLTNIAIDRNGTIYATDGWHAALVISAAPPNLATPLASQRVAPGGTAIFSASAGGAAPIAFQWFKDGAAIPGATSPALTIGAAQESDLGTYTVRLANTVGSVVSNPAVLSFVGSDPTALTNLSVRGTAGAGAQSLIVGFVIGGQGATGTRPLVIRGVGPALGYFGIPGFLADPALSVFSGASVVASNDNWNGDPQVSAGAARIGAVPFPSPTSRDAALHHAGLGAGAYTVQLSGVGSASGMALAEICDAMPANSTGGFTPRLLNASARAHVGPGPDKLVADFDLGGATARTFLIRAIGPTLGNFGITGALSDPQLELFRGRSLLQANDDWAGDAVIAAATGQVGAFALTGASRDAALLVTLPPGSYTAEVSGVARTSGIALAEIYEIP